MAKNLLDEHGLEHYFRNIGPDQVLDVLDNRLEGSDGSRLGDLVIQCRELNDEQFADVLDASVDVAAEVRRICEGN